MVEVKRYNILYIISCFTHGVGGHVYSLESIAKLNSINHNVMIISVGLTESPILKKSGIKYLALTSDRSIIARVNEINEIISNFNIDIVHTFDLTALLLSKIIQSKNEIKSIHTKCGGESPKLYFPKVNDIIVFTESDVDYFKSRGYRKEENNTIYLPNRVEVPKQCIPSIEYMKEKYKTNEYTIFFRIGRIDRAYEKLTKDSINLIKILNDAGIKSKFINIGAIQDFELYEEYIRLSNDSIHFLTEPFYTINASKFISIADFVIGTGRGAMEAGMLNKKVLCPVKGFDTPVLVTNENLPIFSKFNFSPRTVLGSLNNNSGVNAIIESITEKADHSLGEDFYNRFSTESVINEYSYIYSSLSKKKTHLFKFDFIIHYLYSMRLFNYNKKLQSDKLL